MYVCACGLCIYATLYVCRGCVRVETEVEEAGEVHSIELSEGR